MLAQAGLFFLLVSGNRLEVLSLENLAAIEALHVIHAFAARQQRRAVVITSGVHKRDLDEQYCNQTESQVKPPQVYQDARYNFG